MTSVALYARVSTADQDLQRQLGDLREFIDTEYPQADTTEYADVVGGATEGGGEEYQRLRADIEAGDLDVVVVHELSRLSRLGAGEIHKFISHALEHDTSVRDLEVGLSIDVADDIVDQAVSRLIADVMGDLALVEHKQKLRRIRSGIEAAQEAGRWTGRPPAGFDVEDGHLRVDPEEFLRVRAGLERVASGEPVTQVADDIGVAESSLRYLRDKRADLYLQGEADDDRVAEAVEEITPLPEADHDTSGAEFEDTVREIVRDELEYDHFDTI